MLSGCFGAILPGKAELAGAEKVIANLHGRRQRGQRRPLLPGAASCPHHSTILPLTTHTTGPLDGSVHRTRPHPVPILSESPGHTSGRAEGRRKVSAAILSSARVGWTGTSASSKTDDRTRVPSFSEFSVLPLTEPHSSSRGDTALSPTYR